MLDLHSKYVRGPACFSLEPPCSHLAPTFSFHRQPEQTLENISHIMSLPRCSLQWFLVTPVAKMQKSFSGLQQPSDRLGLLPLHLSLFLWLSSSLTLTGFPDDPRMCQASSHIRAFIVTLLCLGGPLPQTAAWPTADLSSLCTDVTTSVKPHPNRVTVAHDSYLLPITPILCVLLWCSP